MAHNIPHGEPVAPNEIGGEIGDWASPARIELREALAPHGDGSTCQTSQYEYELIDVAGDFRRAFHFHDAEWFLREYVVAVHEHCDQPLKSATCTHYSGTPIKDSYAGATRLLDAWTEGPIHCSYASLPVALRSSTARNLERLSRASWPYSVGITLPWPQPDSPSSAHTRDRDGVREAHAPV